MSQPEIDALTERSPADVLWSRVNTAETFPGVVTPITWSMYGEALEWACRLGFNDLGIIPKSATGYGEVPGERLLGIFHGRLAVNVDIARRLMSGLPGVSGDDIERDLLGSVREGIPENGYPRRTPAVLMKGPWTLATRAREPRRIFDRSMERWSRCVGPDGPRVDPHRLLLEGLADHSYAARLQGRTRMLLQASVSGMVAIAESAGMPEAASSLMASSEGPKKPRSPTTCTSLPTIDSAGDVHRTARLPRPQQQRTLLSLLARGHRPLERLLPAMRDAQPPVERRAEAAASSESGP